MLFTAHCSGKLKNVHLSNTLFSEMTGYINKPLLSATKRTITIPWKRLSEIGKGFFLLFLSVFFLLFLPLHSSLFQPFINSSVSLCNGMSKNGNTKEKEIEKEASKNCRNQVQRVKSRMEGRKQRTKNKKNASLRTFRSGMFKK